MTTPTCYRCIELERQLAELLARVDRLEAELAAAKKNSANSSKPPSSDITKPPAADSNDKKKKKRRKRGGQPGHPKHDRLAFEPSQIDQTVDYFYRCCPDCHGPVLPADLPPRIVQQVELIAKPVEITEYRSQPCRCPNCQKVHFAPMEEPIRQAGLVGSRLTAVIAYLKGACHCSFSTIRKFVRDVLGVTISCGKLASLIAKVTKSLDHAYDELLRLLPGQERLNVDETGHKNNGERMWTWCFRAELFTLFKIDPSRGSDVLLDVLGEEFNGVLCCDYFSAYRKYMRECDVLVQFCLAHLIRDLKFLAEHPDARNRAYGRRVLNAARELFGVIHRRDQLSAAAFADALEDAGNILWGEAVYRTPHTREAKALARRFRKHGDSYIRFLTTPGIEPTNNLAEQAIRFVVIDRKVTQGSRSQTGQRWLERIWTVMATCAQQGRSAFQFLSDSIVAFLHRDPGPSLVPNTS